MLTSPLTSPQLAPGHPSRPTSPLAPPYRGRGRGGEVVLAPNLAPLRLIFQVPSAPRRAGQRNTANLLARLFFIGVGRGLSTRRAASLPFSTTSPERETP